MVELGEICENLDGKRIPITKSDRKPGPFPYYGASGIVDYVVDYLFDEDLLLISEDGANLRARVTPIAFSVSGRIWVNNHAHVLSFKDMEIQKFVEIYINSINIENYVTGTAQPKLNQKALNSIKIPLPNIQNQKEIVEEIEGYQKIIDGARQVVKNYKPQIPINPSWPMVELGEVITLQRGYDLPKKDFIVGSYPVVGSNGIIGYHNEYKHIKPGVVTGRSGTIGKVHFITENYWPHNTSLFVNDFKGNHSKYIYYILQSLDLKSLGERTSAVPSLDRKNAHRLKVYLPTVREQKNISDQLDNEQTIVDKNKELIKIFEQKIKDKISSVWGE